MTSINLKALTVLIVEDEALIADELRRILKKIGFNRITIATTENEATDFLKQQDYKLVFIDINLNGQPAGIKIAERCEKKGFHFIFLTSYEDDETIKKATQMSPIAYLIKPFNQAKINATVQVFLNSHLKKSNLELIDGKKVYQINPDNIVWIEANSPYVNIHFEAKTITLRISLSTILSMLPQDSFVQTHRAFIVNKNCITKQTLTEVVVGTKVIPIARSFRKKMKTG